MPPLLIPLPPAFPCLQYYCTTVRSVAKFMESRGNVEDALRIATDPDYKFELAVQLGRLDIAKVRGPAVQVWSKSSSKLQLVLVVVQLGGWTSPR